MFETVVKLYDASNYLCTVREEFFFSDEMEFSMEMFAEMCSYIKITYQIVFETEDKTVIIHALKVFDQLSQIAHNAEITDIEHECVSMLALLAYYAIEDIINVKAKQNVLTDFRSGTIWYDFENDTPEDVFNRIRGFLINEENGGFYTAEEAYFRL